MEITATDLQEMVTHWLGCPPNGYLGSDYGSDVASLLQAPFSAGGADALIRKLRADIAVMSQLPQSTLNVYAEQQGADKLVLAIEVAGAYVLLDAGGRSVSQG